MLTISLVALSILIVLGIDTLFALNIEYTSLFCSQEDKEYIIKNTNVNIECDFNIIYCKSDLYHNHAEIYIIKKNSVIPHIYGDRILVEENNDEKVGTIEKYIMDTHNSSKASIICLLPIVILETILLVIIIVIIKYIS